jgi:hypothetical protein
LAQVRFRILQAPTPRCGTLFRRGVLCSHWLLSGRTNQNLEYPNLIVKVKRARLPAKACPPKLYSCDVRALSARSPLAARCSRRWRPRLRGCRSA